MTATLQLGRPDYIVDFAIEVGRKFISLINKLPWIIALVILVPLGLLYVGAAILPLRHTRKKAVNACTDINQFIDKINERDAMELLIDIEDVRKLCDYIVVNGSRFFVLAPVVNECRLIADAHRETEKILFKKAYPDYERPLTPEEEQEIIKAFAPWKDEDERVDC